MNLSVPALATPSYAGLQQPSLFKKEMKSFLCIYVFMAFWHIHVVVKGYSVTRASKEKRSQV